MAHQYQVQDRDFQEQRHIHALLELTLSPAKAGKTVSYVGSLLPEQRREFLDIANSHHVVLRSLQPVFQQATLAGNTELADWAKTAIEKEDSRISTALRYLHEICTEVESAGCPVTVMKSLDHWPDLGNDLDLYSSADIRSIRRVLSERFKARSEARSWGDRLAGKWNFVIPGLPELVEFHLKRLGQTGEHRGLAQRFVTRRMEKEVGGMKFHVPAPEERIVVATLQRMYRHFYFRVCDIVNSAMLVESGSLDFFELRRATEAAGIWEGAATFLVIVSDYVRRYRGYNLNLPRLVYEAAPFGGEKILIRERFLRVPIMPEGAKLFTREITHVALRGDLPATLRLNLLPPLALAAAVAYKLTGSDKGVW
ncbi:MAG: hypothetical protein DMG67_06220 [Acidobacteria bacterium]|nr:MAG: hypothetical protein DMG67_06220 [Acidobacteriota bacterium]